MYKEMGYMIIAEEKCQALNHKIFRKKGFKDPFFVVIVFEEKMVTVCFTCVLKSMDLGQLIIGDVFTMEEVFEDEKV